MVINQKRIMNVSKLKGLEVGKKVRVVMKNPESQKLNQMGFGDDVVLGQCILPEIIGPASRLNANGKFIIHRDLEKEICYRMVEWTYKQFAGRDDFKEVTDSTYVPYSRYQRTLIPPNALEFTMDEIEGELVLTSEEFEFGVDDEKIVVAVNVLLEYFGYCEVLSDDFSSAIKGEVIRLNWKVLPKGKVPWETQRERIEPFLSKARGNNRKVIDKRLEAINSKMPDFTAIGEGGFSGYIVHGFSEKGLYVLESVEVNNATYVLSKNWEEISKLTKADILKNDLYEFRVIHSPGWYENIRKILD